MFLAFLFIIFNFSKLKSLDPYKVLILILLFAVVVGIHGLSHAMLEKQYNYVPFGLWALPQKPMTCPCMKMKHNAM